MNDPDDAVQSNITAYWDARGPDYETGHAHMVEDEDAWSDVWLAALSEPPADVLDAAPAPARSPDWATG